MINDEAIRKIFGKSLDNISLKDLEKFFLQEQEETNILEFKSGGVEIIDIYKEITAFLNTEGGILIIGSPREEKVLIGKNYKSICKGVLTYSTFRNKDWLIQKITSNISPIPTNLKVKEFLTKKGAVFIVEVPQSQTPPHQCSSDGRYYIRMEREAKPAPHGLVQALFDKRRKPELSADFEVQRISDNRDEITVSIKNKSMIPADKISFIVEVYNVNEIENSRSFVLQEDTLGEKFVCSLSSDKVLVRIVSIPVNFIVQHKNQEYLVSANFWCKDADYNFRYVTYSPKKQEFTGDGTLESGELLIDAIERIHSI